MSNLDKYLKTITTISGRYLIVAGVSFLIFYIIFKKLLAHKKIQERFPATSDYLREIFFSIITILIFGLVPVTFIFNEKISKYTLLYKDIAERGWIYYFNLFPIMLFMHDTYFYWMHRLMHHKVLFKWFHLVHHRSTNPSPWAAYAFHPLEAVVEAGILLLFIFTLPMHRSNFIIFFLFMIIYNVYGHLGWELYPKNFHKTRIGKWINTSVAHNQHHQYFKGNYSLYFLFWDRIMGTLRKDYDEQFETVKAK
jgi:sterol desaturase/sphingolipid hydroxylase (fatty acid hydroxylase superfamily)